MMTAPNNSISLSRSAPRRPWCGRSAGRGILPPPEKPSELLRHGDHQTLEERLAAEEPDVDADEVEGDFIDDGEVDGEGRTTGRSQSGDRTRCREGPSATMSVSTVPR